MHGQLPRSLDEKLLDIEQSYRWLKYGDIKGETESTVVAAQDQAIVKSSSTHRRRSYSNKTRYNN
jgi:hypothetical protein